MQIYKLIYAIKKEISKIIIKKKFILVTFRFCNDQQHTLIISSHITINCKKLKLSPFLAFKFILLYNDIYKIYILTISYPFSIFFY